MTPIKMACITGANGFMGTHLTLHLAKQGIPVQALILPGTNTQEINHPLVTIYEGDITKPHTLNDVLKGVSHVFHLAAVASDWGPESLFESVNYQGTINMAQAAIKAGVKRFVHMSSLSVHAYNGHVQSDESTPLNGSINAYARSKVKCEDYLSTLRETTEMEVVVIRPGIMPYGPGDRLSFWALCKALESNTFAYINGGNAKFCLSFIDNLVEGIILASTHEKSAHQTYILCDDQMVSWKEFIGFLCKKLQVAEPKLSIRYSIVYAATFLLEGWWRLWAIKKAPLLTFYRISVPRKDLVFSNKKAKTELGYAPNITFEKGMEQTVHGYLKESKQLNSI